MAIELFNDGKHVCLMFNDLVGEEEVGAVQANQFLIVSDGEGALIDPAGNMTYNALLIAMQKYFPYKDLKYIFASHQDPDIVASLNRWLSATNCTLYVSRLWERFVPHFCTLNRAEGRVTGIPDEGMGIAMRDTTIYAVPAHFLHAEGNFQFYDRKSKILFSGDMGASMVRSADIVQPNYDHSAIQEACVHHGGLPSALHGVQQSLPLLGQDGERHGCFHAGAAAWQILRRQGGHRRLPRLDRTAGMRHRPVHSESLPFSGVSAHARWL